MLDIIRFLEYIFAMRIEDMRADNLVKLLEGVSLLEDKDQWQIISVVDALGFAYDKKNSNEYHSDIFESKFCEF